MCLKKTNKQTRFSRKALKALTQNKTRHLSYWWKNTSHQPITHFYGNMWYLVAKEKEKKMKVMAKESDINSKFRDI